jgi:hypothetical protein
MTPRLVSQSRLSHTPQRVTHRRVLPQRLSTVRLEHCDLSNALRMCRLAPRLELWLHPSTWVRWIQQQSIHKIWDEGRVGKQQRLGLVRDAQLDDLHGGGRGLRTDTPAHRSHSLRPPVQKQVDMLLREGEL